MGGLAVYIDIERALNKEFMIRMGVDWDKLYRPKKIPASIEEVFQFIEQVASTARLHIPNKSRPVVVVWDSVGATTGADESETAYEDSPGMGLEARAMSRGLRKIIKVLDEGYITLICINQLREKINAMAFGDNTTTPHGKALPFYSSVRIKLKSVGQIKNSKTDETIGVKTEAKVFKNKVGPSHRTAAFPLHYDYGVNDEISIMDFLIDHGIIQSNKAWKVFEFNGEKHQWQGTADWIELLKNPEIKKFVSEKVNELMVKKFNQRPDTIELDTESLMEMEQLKQNLNKSL